MGALKNENHLWFHPLNSINNVQSSINGKVVDNFVNYIQHASLHGNLCTDPLRLSAILSHHLHRNSVEKSEAGRH